MTLQKLYTDVASGYVCVFQQQTGLDYDNVVQSYPIDIYLFGDYFISLYDIRYCVDNNIDCNELIDYHDWLEDNNYKFNKTSDFREWCKGENGYRDDKRNWTRNMRIMRKAAKKQIRR